MTCHITSFPVSRSNAGYTLPYGLFKAFPGTYCLPPELTLAKRPSAVMSMQMDSASSSLGHSVQMVFSSTDACAYYGVFVFPILTRGVGAAVNELS